MTDPLSIAAGIIAVITATIQSSTALYQTIESFKNYPQRVRELAKQLLSLTEILASLRELSEQDESVGAPLEIPLRECGATCERLRGVLELHRGSLSGGNRISAWVSFKFKNGDIVSFMETLAVYKSTMAIAIADANLRTSKVTLQVLNEYKREVDATTGYLQQHFEEVSAKLDRLQAPTVSGQQETARLSEYLDQQREEQSNVEHCLQICRRFQADIDQAQFHLAQGRQPSSTTNSPASAIPSKDMTLANLTTLSWLKACGLETAHTIRKLSKQATTAQSRLLDEHSTTHQGQGQLPHGDYVRVEDQDQVDDQAIGTQEVESELSSVKQLLNFCKDASSRATPDRVHVVEDITVGDDSRQICISTVGDLFKIKRAKAGDNAFQFFGSIAPEHLHEITMLHAKERHTFVAEEAESSESQEELQDQNYTSSASRVN